MVKLQLTLSVDVNPGGQREISTPVLVIEDERWDELVAHVGRSAVDVMGELRSCGSVQNLLRKLPEEQPRV